MEKNAKIFVAGHRGLVGSALVRRLQADGYKSLLTRTHAELDLRNQQDVERFFEEERPEYVFLAAAKVGGILANSTYKAEFIHDNIMIAANVINFAYKYGVKKLLNLGSSCIYPRSASQPMKEEALLTGSLEPTNEPYAIAKISAIKLCRYYNEQYGTNYISAMPANLYGPGDNFNLETSHVLPALIRKIHLGECLRRGDFESIRSDLKRFPVRDKKTDDLTEEEIIDLLSNFDICAEKGNSTIRLELWGSGNPSREFLYVDDLASACILLMEKYDYKDIGEIINIGTGKEYKISELAEKVKEIVGFHGEISWDSSKPDGMPRKLLDASRIKALGWQAKVGLEEGLKKTYSAVYL